MGKEELAFLTRVTKSPKGVEAHKDYTDQVQDAYPGANQGCSADLYYSICNVLDPLTDEEDATMALTIQETAP